MPVMAGFASELASRNHVVTILAVMRQALVDCRMRAWQSATDWL